MFAYGSGENTEQAYADRGLDDQSPLRIKNSTHAVLYALDATTGLEKLGGPVLVKAHVNGTGSGTESGVVPFVATNQLQRPALLLLNGIVYIAFGSYHEPQQSSWHGGVMGYNAATLVQTGVVCMTPNGYGAGIWMSGNGLAADVLDPVNKPYGRMFLATGNGDYTGAVPYANTMDFGDSILDLNLQNGAPVITDEFTPSTEAVLAAGDVDRICWFKLANPAHCTCWIVMLLEGTTARKTRWSRRCRRLSAIRER